MIDENRGEFLLYLIKMSMKVVEFVLIIQNFVVHVGDYFPYSKKNLSRISSSQSVSPMLTINAVLR